MYTQSEIQKKVTRNIDHNKSVIMREARNPLVFGQEMAEKICKGWEKLRTLNPDEVDVIKNLSREEIAKHWQDNEVRAALGMTFKAFDRLNAAFMGMSPSQMTEKNHDGHIDRSAGMAILNDQLILANEARLDMGWSVAFNAQDLQNFETGAIMDLVNMFRFKEMRSSDQVPEPEALGTMLKDKFGPRFFASAFNFSPRAFRYAPVTVNSILTGMRLAYAQQLDMLAYRVIADTSGITSVDTVSKVSGATALDAYTQEVVNARATADEAHFKLIERASDVKGAKNRSKRLEAPLAVNANETCIMYFNHKHFALVADMQRPQPGQDRVLPTLNRNVAFVSSIYMPAGGGHTVTGEDSATTVDELGFYGTTKDSYPPQTVGGMLVLPGFRNYYGNFRPLTFLDDQQRLSETTTLAAKFECNMVMDARQKMHVKLKSA